MSLWNGFAAHVDAAGLPPERLGQRSDYADLRESQRVPAIRPCIGDKAEHCFPDALVLFEFDHHFALGVWSVGRARCI